MSQPLISIIVPVYNVAPYLSICLDSILSQNYTTWELLLIDDGSRDNSGTICDDYAQRDERIKVFHIDNHGVSNARNIGMKQAHGTWITFVDGDDWVANDYLTGLSEPIIKEPNVDFVQAGIQNYKEGEGFSFRNRFDNYTDNDPVFLLNSFRGISGSKLLKKNIIERYKLEQDVNLVVGEDWVFTLDYILHVNKYCFIDRADYFYRYNSSSVTHSSKKADLDKVLKGFFHRYNSFVRFLHKYDVAEERVQFRWSEMSNLFCQEVLVRIPQYRISLLKELTSLLDLPILIKYQRSLKKRLALSFLKITGYIFVISRILQPQLRYREGKAILLMIISWVVAKCIKSESDLWLFCERGTDARDNGFWMFRYVMQNHPKINAKYIISVNSEDRQNLVAWKDKLVNSGSFTHYILMWQAKYCCSTHTYQCFPYYVSHIRLLCKMAIRLCPKSKTIWLQHGITCLNIPQYHYDKMPLDLMICGVKPEYEYIKNVFGYPLSAVKYTGLARFDGLHHVVVNKKQILLMPTWRKWLNDSNFLSSEYFYSYRNILSNPLLHRFLECNHLTLVFYPHYEVQPFINEFKNSDLSDNIIIADKRNYDVQQLLKESALLITDHSSVFFDFAYMKKPIVFYQFDNEDYYKKHYQEGYFDYKNEFAYWTDNETDLLEALRESFHNDFEMTKAQNEKCNKYFLLCDNHNCERIFNAIKEL